jgi:outer membrane lipoprotein SlyB
MGGFAMQVLTGRTRGAIGIALIMAGAVVAASLAATATAAAQQPGRIRGQVDKVDGSTLVLKLRDGSSLNVKLAQDTRVSALVKASLADIKNDTFIGVAGMPQPDGTIKAFSIHIFLPAQRGVVPDRHGPWDARPGSTMTNAYVQSTVKGKDGETLTVKYKDGEQKIVVTPDTAIAAAAPGSRDELKPGAQIIIMQSEKQPDGSILARSLYVGRGLTPAM